jgi:hypothetical protein
MSGPEFKTQYCQKTKKSLYIISNSVITNSLSNETVVYEYSFLPRETKLLGEMTNFMFEVGNI